VEPSAAVQQIILKLDSKDEETRLKAGLELLATARRDDVAFLSRSLKEGGNPDRQVFIIEALAKIGDRRSAEALRFELQRGEVVARRAAVSALGFLNFNYPVADLVNLMQANDKLDLSLRKRAASALGRIGTTEAIYALEQGVAKTGTDGPVGRAGLWALDVARGKVDERRVDSDFPRGQHLDLFYKGTKYKFYHPSVQPRVDLADGRPIRKANVLVCIHGSDLAYQDLYMKCISLAQQRQLALLVPYFDDLRFPAFEDFNIRGERSDKRLFEILDHISKTVAVETREIYFFGEGEGGSFLQKLALVYPERVGRAVAIIPGEFTFPREDYFFPAGIRVTPLAPDVHAELYGFVKSNLRLVASTAVAAKMLKRFVSELDKYSSSHGLIPRIEFQGIGETFMMDPSRTRLNPRYYEPFFFPTRISE
jgi:hypothetical protein